MKKTELLAGVVAVLYPMILGLERIETTQLLRREASDEGGSS